MSKKQRIEGKSAMDEQNQDVVGQLLRMGQSSPTVSRFVRDYLSRLVALARGYSPLDGDLAPGDRIAVEGTLVQQHYFRDGLEELNQLFVSVQRDHDASKPIPALGLLMLLAANSCAAPLRGYWQNRMLAGTISIGSGFDQFTRPEFLTDLQRQRESYISGAWTARSKREKAEVFDTFVACLQGLRQTMELLAHDPLVPTDQEASG